MPASIVHMLIARKTRNELKNTAYIKSFVEEVLDQNHQYMELGSLGPDLPYYESMTKGAMDLLLKRSDKPMGVDQWSYQMHSKDPNLFPLKMLEITWKETAIEKEDWEEDDKQKFAFTCGYLTHMAADQIIHPLVNLICGPYYKRGDARDKHRQCEVYQDIYMFNNLKDSLGLEEFPRENFNAWCDLNVEFGANAPTHMRYLIQKAFVEAHSVMPSEDNIEDWFDGILTVLRLVNSIGPYVSALKDMEPESSRYKEYVDLKLPENSASDKQDEYNKFIGGKKYDDFFKQAVELSSVYIRAAYFLYRSDSLNDLLRNKFLTVVRNADLSAPLETDIFKAASQELKDWK